VYASTPKPVAAARPIVRGKLSEPSCKFNQQIHHSIVPEIKITKINALKPYNPYNTDFKQRTLKMSR
jgi:hypothetical protein